MTIRLGVQKGAGVQLWDRIMVVGVVVVEGWWWYPNDVGTAVPYRIFKGETAFDFAIRVWMGWLLLLLMFY